MVTSDGLVSNKNGHFAVIFDVLLLCEILEIYVF